MYQCIKKYENIVSEKLDCQGTCDSGGNGWLVCCLLSVTAVATVQELGCCSLGQSDVQCMALLMEMCVYFYLNHSAVTNCI